MSKFMPWSLRTHPQPLPSKAGQAPITPAIGIPLGKKRCDKLNAFRNPEPSGEGNFYKIM